MTSQSKSLSMTSSSRLSPSPSRASLPALSGRRRLINRHRSNLLNNSDDPLNVSLSINNINNNENNNITNNDNSRDNNNDKNNKNKHINNYNNNNNNNSNDLNSNNSKHFLPIQIPITPPTYKSIENSQSHRASSPATLINKTSTSKLPIEASTCLEGVVACLDIRTEDGDDVSQNFEKALHSMGAKTRKTFSDNVTHLIFKNGSPNNIKKALSKKCKIVNLLWITNCKCKGKRLPEDSYLIDQPESLALSGSKKRKSMEPGKVKALALENDHLPEKKSKLLADSRLSKTIRGSNNRKNNKNVSYWETSAIIPKEVTIQHAPSRPEIPTEFTEDIDLTLDGSEPEKIKIDDDKIAPSSSSLRRLSLKDKPLQKPTQPPSQRPQVSEKIKAGFYIDMPKSASSPSIKSISSDTEMTPIFNNKYNNNNNNNNIDTESDEDKNRNINNNSMYNNSNNNKSNNNDKTNTDIPLSLSPHLKNTNIFATSVTSSYQPLSPSTTTLRRRRRSLINKSNRPFVLDSRPRLSLHAKQQFSSEISPSSQADHHMDQQNGEPSSNKHYNIVLTSMTEKDKRKYIEILNRLGNYTLSNRVDENTTHLIVGCPRRTKSVILGFIYSIWLVTADWLIDSDKKNKYLEELRYECIVYFPRARAARLREPLLPSNVNIYVESSALDEDLARLLITKAGANMVNDINDANIVINNSYIHPDVVTVKENWLLDSIEHWRYLSTGKYQPYII